MSKQRFKITRFTNPSGVDVFRLSGALNGERIRKNYLNLKSETEAEAFWGIVPIKRSGQKLR